MVQNLKLLVADPNSDILKEAKDFFQGQLYEVTTAQNGKMAQLYLYQEKFFAAILGLELENHNTMTVARYIKSNHPGLRVIFMAPDLEYFNSRPTEKSALERMGFTDIFSRPFYWNDLRDALENYQSGNDFKAKEPSREGQSQEVEVSEDDEKFTSIRIEEFMSGQRVQYDVFVRLNTGRYVKILHEGDSFSTDRINKYKNEKKVKHLYLHNSDRKKFIRFGEVLAEKISENDKVGVGVKLSLLKNVGEKIVEEMYLDGIRPQILHEGKNFCKTMYKTLSKNVNLSGVLREFEQFDPNAYTHSYLVCFFSSLLAKQLNWQSNFIYETLGLTSLLHDLGTMKLPRELALKDPELMTEEEAKEYKTHAQMTVELLNKNNLVSSAVGQAIMQHHEKEDGTGYPLGLRGHKLLPLAKIISMTDEFSDAMIKNKLAPLPTFKKLLSEGRFVERHGKKIVEVFAKIFLDAHSLNAKPAQKNG